MGFVLRISWTKKSIGSLPIFFASLSYRWKYLLGPSAQSHDYFRVNRSQLDSRVVDAELPIDSALAAVDRAVPGGGFLS